jgi:hypothetical protein
MASQKIIRHESIAQNAKSISIQGESGMATQTGRSAIPQANPQGKIFFVLLFSLLLLLLLLTAIELSLGGISPYSSTDKINRNKYTYTCLQNWSNHKDLIRSGHHTCAHGPDRRGTTPALQMAGSLVAMTVCSLVYIIEDLVNSNAFIFRKVDSGSNKFLKALPSTCSLSWSVT